MWLCDTQKKGKETAPCEEGAINMTHKQKDNEIIITFRYTNRHALDVHNQHSASRWGLARAILRSGSVPLLKQCPAISSSRTA